MKRFLTSFSSLSLENGSGMVRDRFEIGSASPHKFVILLFCLLFVGIGQMWSADVEVYTLSGTTTATGNAYATASDVTQSEKTWKVTANTEQNPWRVGGKASKKGKTDTFYRDIYCKAALTSDNVNKVILSHGTTDLTGNHGVDSVELFVSTAQNKGGTITSKILRTFKTSDTIIFNRPAGADWSNKYFTIRYKIHVQGTSNKHFQFVYAKFYKAGCTELGSINGSFS